jgi:hypothetical protein
VPRNPTIYGMSTSKKPWVLTEVSRKEQDIKESWAKD